LLERIKGSALGYVSRRSYSRRDLEHKLKERFLPRSTAESAKNYQSRYLQSELADFSQESKEYILDSLIEDVMGRLEQVHLVDDEEYAAVYARSKWRQSKWSPKRIESELHRKGVDDDVIRVALQSVFGVEKQVRVLDDGDVELGEERNRQAFELVAMAKRQYQSYGSSAISEDAKRRRLIGFLQRRGYGWDVVKGVLKKVQDDGGQHGA